MKIFILSQLISTILNTNIILLQDIHKEFFINWVGNAYGYLLPGLIRLYSSNIIQDKSMNDALQENNKIFKPVEAAFNENWGHNLSTDSFFMVPMINRSLN